MKKTVNKLHLKKRLVATLNSNAAVQLQGGKAAASSPFFTCNGSCVGTCFCPSPPFTQNCPVKP